MSPADLGRGRRHAVGLAAGALALLVLAVGCGDESGSAAPEASPTPETSTGPVETDAPVDEAVADLTERLDAAPDEVEVLRAEAVTWNDGSLGCPEPGKVYTQALVDGYKIVLRVGNRTYPYHSGGGRGPFLCENLQPSIPPQPDASS